MSKEPSNQNSKSDQNILRAIDYVRQYNIEQKIQEFIGQVVHERPIDPYGVLANQFANESDPATIDSIKGREIILSTGRPSLQVDVYANMLGRTCLLGSSNAPIGTSVFTQEQKPYLDTTLSRYMNLGSKNAVALVEAVSNALRGKRFSTIDQYDPVIKKALDSKQAINVLSSVSFAIAKASARVANQQLFEYLYESFYPQQTADHFSLPTPAITVIEGGMHAPSQLSIESIFIIPKSGISYIEQLRISSEVVDKLREKIVSSTPIFQVGKTGGFVIDVTVISSAIDIVEQAIKDAGFTVGTDFSIGIDCAATSFYDSDKQQYQIEKGVYKTSGLIIQYLLDLVKQKPSITLINDGISEIDHGGWEEMREALKAGVKVFGCDVYASQSILARRGLKKQWTDGLFILPGAAGTLSDASETAKLFKQRGLMVAVGRRSGETTDSIITDFAVAMQADFLMAGGLIGSEGVEKYNRLLRIYEYLRDRSMLQ